MTLKDFLVEAKLNTYAANGEGNETKSPDGSRELVFEKGLWRYRDRYFGFDPFIGEEIVWHRGVAIWGMNYCGYITCAIVDKKMLYNFLKSALRKANNKLPLRGPLQYRRDKWQYGSSTRGNLKRFTGWEIICFEGIGVYELYYHGGLISR